MSATNASHVIAAVVCAALLAGCAGGTQLAPAAPGAAQSSVRQAAWRAATLGGPRLFANDKAESRARLGHRLGAPLGLRFIPLVPHRNAQGTFSYVIASDNVEGSLDVFDESTGTELSSNTNLAGWGAATERKTGDVAIGVYGGTVGVYHASATGLTEYATLELTGAGAAYNAAGVAFDSKSDVYASNWPSNTVDEWNAATIEAGSSKPDNSYTLASFAYVYFVTTDGTKVIVNGFDTSYNYVVAELLVKGPKAGSVKVLQKLGSLSAGTGFPGGLAVDAQHNLIVNNQYGTLYQFAKPWTKAATSTFAWNVATDEYTDIALDGPQTSLWAANVDFSGDVPVTNAIANGYAPSSGFSGSTGLTTAPFETEQYLGITVTPAGRPRSSR